MRYYDELRELDMEEDEASLRYSQPIIQRVLKVLSLRSFLVFPLSLTIPGKGQFRKLLEPDQTYSGRPVYNHTETGERIFFRGELMME